MSLTCTATSITFIVERCVDGRINKLTMKKYECTDAQGKTSQLLEVIDTEVTTTPCSW